MGIDIERLGKSVELIKATGAANSKLHTAADWLIACTSPHIVLQPRYRDFFVPYFTSPSGLTRSQRALTTEEMFPDFDVDLGDRLSGTKLAGFVTKNGVALEIDNEFPVKELRVVSRNDGAGNHKVNVVELSPFRTDPEDERNTERAFNISRDNSLFHVDYDKNVTIPGLEPKRLTLPASEEIVNVIYSLRDILPDLNR